MEALKELKTFSSRIEAEIVRSFLKSNSIESTIYADDVGSMYPSQDFVMGVKLMVLGKDYSLAKKLLATFEAEENL